MVEPVERARFLARFGASSSKPKEHVEEHDIARILASDRPSLEDIKTMRGTRYADGFDERFEYANSLLAEASDYLRAHTLRALVRAEITEAEAAKHLKQNKAFFKRLASLLPSIMRFFGKGPRRQNPLLEGEDDDPDDNWSEKNRMRHSSQEIELCKHLLQESTLSEMALRLLNARIRHEEKEQEDARTTYGPRQVYISQMNQEQWETCS
jgi:hypothetical protein